MEVKIHELKIHPRYFKDVMLGIKKFEIRLNDRNYQERDILFLNEYDPETKKHTGNSVKRRITYVLHEAPGLMPGYVILQMEKLIL